MEWSVILMKIKLVKLWAISQKIFKIQYFLAVDLLFLTILLRKYGELNIMFKPKICLDFDMISICCNFVPISMIFNLKCNYLIFSNQKF